ncbi:MAG: hypothetical protein C4538_02110 [Nitrospiraceae bacterium]|nr:MAG: hypothetical protein C4538_02110 [Nitrospiraceae bacterium]
MKNIIFTAIVLSVFITLYALSTKNVVPLPPDDNHAGIMEQKMCFDCHGPDKETPLSKKHPPKYECFKCHKTAKSNP